MDSQSATGGRTARGHAQRAVAVWLAIFLACPMPALASPDVWRQVGWEETDFSRHSVDLDEIVMGIAAAPGQSTRDKIPAIDDPAFEPVGSVADIPATSPVISIEINGDARAYPLAIMTWHEIVNDTVGGVPVAVTYCPLCNTGLVFERTVDGRVLDFGTSGMLRHSDLVMYDRQTSSWWQQFNGEAIVGAMTGATLRGLPARLEAFELFAERLPDGKVLVPNDPGKRLYGRNPYVGYDSASSPFLNRGELPEGIDPMARVVMVAASSGAKSVALDHLKALGRIELDDVVVTWTPGQASALDTAQISQGRDVGNVVAQRNDNGALQDVIYHVTFAFAFHAFHPSGTIVTGR